MHPPTKVFTAHPVCAIALSLSARDHVPYRQSRLTNLLKDSLGGNCKTVMIANIWGVVYPSPPLPRRITAEVLLILMPLRNGIHGPETFVQKSPSKDSFPHVEFEPV